MRVKLLGLLVLTSIIAGVGFSRWRAVHQRRIAFAQANESGAWVPLVAKQTVKVYQNFAGGKTLIQERTGSYLRNRAGSVYQRTLSLLGPHGDSTAHLQDAQTGQVYRINYKSKKVTIIGMAGGITPRQPVAPDEFRRHYAADQWLGEKVLSGFECEGYRIPPVNPGATEGEMWVAPSLNFLPVENKIIDPPQNGEVLVLLEDIHAGVDPDPELLRVPEGFTLVEVPPAPSGK